MSSSYNYKNCAPEGPAEIAEVRGRGCPGSWFGVEGPGGGGGSAKGRDIEANAEIHQSCEGNT